MDRPTLEAPEGYGGRSPSPSDRSPDKVHKGLVVGFFIRSTGLVPSGHESVGDEVAWRHCIQCPSERTCFDLSTARLQ